MIDAGSIIGALMEGGLKGGGGAHLKNALGPGGLGNSGMGDILGGLLGGGAGGGLGSLLGGGGSTGGLGGMLGGLLGGNAGSGVGSAAMGGVLGSLFGGGGGAGGMAKGGAMAVLGMIAVNALKSHLAGNSGGQAQQSNMQLMAGLREPENAQEQEQMQQQGMLIIRAMINAAKADGEVDEQELEKIVGRLQKSGADESDMAYVRELLAAPMDTDAIVAQVNNPQVGAQVYSASLLAISVDTAAEQAYIEELAGKLGLPQDARNEIHRMLGL